MDLGLTTSPREITDFFISVYVKAQKNTSEIFVNLNAATMRLVFIGMWRGGMRASKKWNEVVKDRNIQQRTQKLLEQSGGECENELREIAREYESYGSRDE